jgi:hypothetical protein
MEVELQKVEEMMTTDQLHQWEIQVIIEEENQMELNEVQGHNM